MTTVLTIALAALLSFLLTGLATAYSRRRGLLDHPGDRHSHTVPTPRGGGAGLVGALLLLGLFHADTLMPPYWSRCLVPGVVLLAIIGWRDDHRPLSARLRFAVQLVAVAILLGCLWQSGVVREGWLLAVGGLFVLWMTNLFNFMDGSNGMAGAQGVFAGAVMAWLFAVAGDAASSALALLLAACCAGFLPWNLGRARVFMGDVGSLSLGFLIGALLLYGAGSGAISLPAALLVMALFLADATLTLLARVLRGEQWYNAHRKHLYQRIIAQGWTHGRVLMLYQAINLLLVLPGIAVAVNDPAWAWPAAIAVALVLGAGWYLSIKRIGVPA